MTFKLDVKGNELLFEALAEGLAEWADEAAAIVYRIAPSEEGRYKRGIRATTWLDGEVIRGEDVRVTRYTGADRESGLQGRRGARATLKAIVYTTNPLGHLLERGTQAHDIPIPVDNARGFHSVRVVKHPGARRKPHFGPGVLASRSIAGSAIARGAAKVLR